MRSCKLEEHYRISSQEVARIDYFIFHNTRRLNLHPIRILNQKEILGLDTDAKRILFKVKPKVNSFTTSERGCIIEIASKPIIVEAVIIFRLNKN